MTDQERAEDQLIVGELKAVGVDVATLQELMHTEKAYAAAIPILITTLAKVETYSLKEIIARSLGTRSARGKAERYRSKEAGQIKGTTAFVDATNQIKVIVDTQSGRVVTVLYYTPPKK
jgi:hypothetical protein